MSGTEIRTQRLLLRPFTSADVGDVFAYASDPEWSLNVPNVPYPYERRHAEEFVARKVPADWEPSFAMEYQGRVIGSVEVNVNMQHRVAELGYGVAREHWGQGFSTEAVAAIVDHVFQALDVDKIVATAAAPNIGSWRVMEKLGMEREGYLRKQRLQRGGVRVDEVRYGLLREDWLSR